MKKIILVILIAFIGLSFVVAEEGAWDWKDNAASTTYGVAFMPVDFYNANKDTSNTVMMTGIDIRLFNGKNITTRGGFYTGTEVGVIMFFSGDAEFEDSYSDGTNTVNYNIVNSDSFIGTVFVLAKYGYRLDLGVKLFGLSLGWEMGMGARIASGNFDFSANIGGEDGSRSQGYDTTAMSMILDTAVEGSVRLGTNLRFVAKLGVMLTPPLVSISDEGVTAIVGDGISAAEADSILNVYDIQSSPLITTVRVGFIVSY
ncbi:MAG: hypothetical protein KAR21_26395 [Spirochaetales bacterium]|nr:hypothetical protein [Spirochaetales bacterium]